MGINDNATVTSHRGTDKLLFVEIVIGTFISVANLLVIIAVRNISYLQSRSNLYIVSLACADFCVGLVVWLVAFQSHSMLERWVSKTELACVGPFSFAFVSVACSRFNTVLIALDRLVYILQPFAYKREVTRLKVKIAIMVVWLLALVWGTVPMYTNTFDRARGQCTFRAVIPPWYRSYANIPILWTGAMATGIIYMILAFKAHQHKRAIDRSTRHVNSFDQTSGKSASGPINAMKSNFRTLKLFCYVFGLLAICWFPYYVIEILSNSIFENEVLYNSSVFLGFLHSGLSVFLYPVYKTMFYRAVLEKLCPCFKFSAHHRHHSCQSSFVSGVTYRSGFDEFSVFSSYSRSISQQISEDMESTDSTPDSFLLNSLESSSSGHPKAPHDLEYSRSQNSTNFTNLPEMIMSQITDILSRSRSQTHTPSLSVDGPHATETTREMMPGHEESPSQSSSRRSHVVKPLSDVVLSKFADFVSGSHPPTPSPSFCVDCSHATETAGEKAPGHKDPQAQQKTENTEHVAPLQTPQENVTQISQDTKQRESCPNSLAETICTHVESMTSCSRMPNQRNLDNAV